MAYISNISAVKSGALGLRLRNWTASIGQRLADHRMYVRTFRELEALSDRDLADMGLTRASLPEIARGAVYKD